jgi:hypothetical protein
MTKLTSADRKNGERNARAVHALRETVLTSIRAAAADAALQFMELIMKDQWRILLVPGFARDPDEAVFLTFPEPSNFMAALLLPQSGPCHVDLQALAMLLRYAPDYLPDSDEWPELTASDIFERAVKGVDMETLREDARTIHARMTANLADAN